ncbi:MAG: LysR family transcriptional regulator [Rhodospirillales bacterium]|nr:LysR family transcriptional regulator [Rhodospirillales bacterium]
MRLEWIEDILAILRAGSLSAAADLRHVSQPAFSRRIRLIEQQVGAELIDRSSRPIRLRATVLAQSEVLQDLSARMNKLLYELRAHDKSGPNRFVIASQHAIATTIVPRLIEALSAVMDVSVHARSGNRDECFDLLVRRRANLMIAYRTHAERESGTGSYLEERFIGEEPVVPVFAADERKQLAEHMRRRELPIIAYPSDVFFGEVMDRELLPGLRENFFIRPKAETALTLTALQLASAGVGVAWVPMSLAAREIAAGSLLQLNKPLTQTTIAMHAMRLAGTQSAATQQVWAMLGSLAGRKEPAGR